MSKYHMLVSIREAKELVEEGKLKYSQTDVILLAIALYKQKVQ